MKTAVYVLALAMIGASAPETFAQEPVQGMAAARNAFPVPSTVRVVRDIVYANYGTRALKLDLYLPARTSSAAPTPGVVVVRGGGWRSGDKDAFGFIAGNLANAGFAAASIEYRTSAEAKFPAAIHDVKAAVRWMRANARMYGLVAYQRTPRHRGVPRHPGDPEPVLLLSMLRAHTR